MGNKQRLSKEFAPSIKAISRVKRKAKNASMQNKLNSIRHNEKRRANVRVTDEVCNICKIEL